MIDSQKNQKKSTEKKRSRKWWAIFILLFTLVIIGCFAIFLSITGGPFEYRLAESRCKKPPIVGVRDDPWFSSDKTIWEYYLADDLAYDFYSGRDNFSLTDGKLLFNSERSYFCTEQEAINAGLTRATTPEELEYYKRCAEELKRNITCR